MGKTTSTKTAPKKAAPKTTVKKVAPRKQLKKADAPFLAIDHPTPKSKKSVTNVKFVKQETNELPLPPMTKNELFVTAAVIIVPLLVAFLLGAWIF